MAKKSSVQRIKQFIATRDKSDNTNIIRIWRIDAVLTKKRGKWYNGERHQTEALTVKKFKERYGFTVPIGGRKFVIICTVKGF